MTEILHIKAQLSAMSDETLIDALKNVDNTGGLDRLQFEFYNRFSGYLYKVALQNFRNFSDSEFLAEEVLQYTFITAFQKIVKFNFPLNCDSLGCTRIIRAWLGKIANNESKKAIGKIVNNKIDYDSLNLPEPEFDQFEELYGQLPPAISNPFLQQLQLALNQLSEKEKHIILTYAAEGCIETNRRKHISDSSLQYLCEFYSTTTDAIKQCKKRALDKIKRNCFE
ncbi:MAG: hypothetical protein V4717_21105 [Bacteroidota bacterium]